MSVTFSPAIRNDVPHIISCLCGAWSQGVVYDCFEDAWAISKEVSSGCSDDYCASEYVYAVPALDEPEVQMSNANAVQILDVLGIAVGEDFSMRCSGVISSTDLKGRVLMAMAINPSDEGTDTITLGNVVDCGRPEGYTDSKLAALLEIADFAEINNVDITWG